MSQLVNTKRSKKKDSSPKRSWYIEVTLEEQIHIKLEF